MELVAVKDVSAETPAASSSASPAPRSSAFAASLPFAAPDCACSWSGFRAVAGTMGPPSTAPASAGVCRDSLYLGGASSSPSPAAGTADTGGRNPDGRSRPCSRLSSSWVEGTAAGSVMFCFEARRRLRNTASAMRAAPATAEATPATMGVESEADGCSLVVEAGEGAGEGAASIEKARQQVPRVGVKATSVQVTQYTINYFLP